MSRKRVKNPVTIENTVEAIGALGTLADLSRQVGAIEAELNEKIDALKAEAAEKAAPLHRDIDDLEAGLSAFATSHKRELFSDRRSFSCTFGQFGFRRSTQLKPAPKYKWGDVLCTLDARQEVDAIRVKKEVNKEALQEWTDDQLAEVHVRRVPNDVFWYEIAAEDLGDDAA